MGVLKFNSGYILFRNTHVMYDILYVRHEWNIRILLERVKNACFGMEEMSERRKSVTLL